MNEVRRRRDAEENIASMRTNALTGLLGSLLLAVVYIGLAWGHTGHQLLMVWVGACAGGSVLMYVATSTASTTQRSDTRNHPWRARFAFSFTGTMWGILFFLPTAATAASEPPLVELCVVFALTAGAVGGTGSTRLGRDLLTAAWTLATIGNLFYGQYLVAAGCAAFLVLVLRSLKLGQQQSDELRSLRHMADAAAEAAQRSAEIDSLTGLTNRIGLERACDQISSRLEGDVLAVFVDLDGFKLVNDTHGHGVGDEVLRIVADRLTGITRHDDVVARLGGDEFFLLLADPGRDRWPDGVRTDIADALAAPMSIGEVEIVLSASVGSHRSASSELRLEEAYAVSDTRMYADKRARQAQGGDRRRETRGSVTASSI